MNQPNTTPRTPQDCLRTNGLCGLWMAFRLWPSGILSSVFSTYFVQIAVDYMGTGIPLSALPAIPQCGTWPTGGAHRVFVRNVNEWLKEKPIRFYKRVPDPELLGGRHWVSFLNPQLPAQTWHTVLAQSRHLITICWIRWMNEWMDWSLLMRQVEEEIYRYMYSSALLYGLAFHGFSGPHSTTVQMQRALLLTYAQKVSSSLAPHPGAHVLPLTASPPAGISSPHITTRRKERTRR